MMVQSDASIFPVISGYARSRVPAYKLLGGENFAAKVA
jgi:hypothetical protein